MVAQVIKLPTVATNNFQSKLTGISAENAQVNSSGSKIVAEQAQQGIQDVRKVAAQAQPSIQDVRNAAEVLNEFVEKIQTNLSFSIDEGSGRSVITVTDTQTGDVIRQIPAKEVLAVANLIRESTTSNIEKVGFLLAEQG